MVLTAVFGLWNQVLSTVMKTSVVRGAMETLKSIPFQTLQDYEILGFELS